MNLPQLLRFIAKHPLNRSAPLGGISRFVRWQSATRLIAAPIALPFVDDTRLLVSRGMAGATGNWYSGLHEPCEMSLILHALRPGELFGDIGANVGSYTVLAAGVVGADVVSVEPLPATFARLEDNVSLNRIGERVELVCAGISSEPGELHFTTGLDTMNRVALPGEQLATQAVPVTTLDALFERRIPAILKIDVEGHELPVIEGASNVMTAPELQVIVMETNGAGSRSGVSDEEIIARIRAFGFTSCRYDWSTRTLVPVDKGGHNTVFVRDVEAMTAKCRAAPRHKLVNGYV